MTKVYEIYNKNEGIKKTTPPTEEQKMFKMPATCHPYNISITKIDDKYLLTIKEQEPLWKQIIKRLFGID